MHAAPALLLLSLLGCSPNPTPAAPGAAPPGAPPAAASPGAPGDASATATPGPAAGAPAAKPDAPKPDAALTPEQRRAYLAALDAGRKAHRAKDYAAAVTHFGAALALQPDDPRALAERGWAQLQAGKLTEAEADTRAALGRTTDHKLLGSAWYNLGRIQEAAGRAPEAVASYGTSLGFRPNETVAKRLAGLSGAERDAYTGAPMAGPFPTLDAWCARQVAAAAADRQVDDPAPVCDPTGAQLGEYDGPRSTTGGPFLEVRVLALGKPLFGDTLDGAAEVAYTLAVRTAAGWYTRDAVVTAYNPGAFGIFAEVSADALTVEHDRLLFAYAHNRHDSDMGLNEIQTDEDRWLLVCAVGPAGPSCVDPVLTASLSERALLAEDEPIDPEIQHTLFRNEWRGAAVVNADGTLVVTGPPNAQLPGHVGTHRLTFP